MASAPCGVRILHASQNIRPGQGCHEKSVTVEVGIFFTFPIWYIAIAIQYRRCFSVGGKLRSETVENPAEAAQGVLEGLQTKGRFPSLMCVVPLIAIALGIILLVALGTVALPIISRVYDRARTILTVPTTPSPRREIAPPLPFRPNLNPQGKRNPVLPNGLNEISDFFNRDQFKIKANQRNGPDGGSQLSPP